MSEDEEYCNNCNKNIPSANFVLHEAHCKRRKQGNAPVQRSREEQMVDYDLCKMKVEKNKLEHHREAECMPQCDSQDHESYCGTRTESSLVQNSLDTQLVGASSLDRHGDKFTKNVLEGTDDDLLSLDAVPLIPESSSEKPSDSLQGYDIVQQVQKVASQDKDKIRSKIKQYKDLGLMPWRLKYGYKDAVILCSEDDLSEVEQFRSNLETKIVLLGTERPKIALLHEIEVLTINKFEALKFALERCTFVFLFVTASFVDNDWATYSSQICLMESIQNPDKNWSIVPVLTDNRENKYKIPISINILKGVRYWSSDEFDKESIRKLFGGRISVRKENERGEGVKQGEWLFQYEEEMHQKDIEEKEKQLRARARNDKIKQQKASLGHSLSIPSTSPSSDSVSEGAPHYQRSKSFAAPNSTDQMIIELFAQASGGSPQSTCVQPAVEHTGPVSCNLKDLWLKQKSMLVCYPISSKDGKLPVQSTSDFSSSGAGIAGSSKIEEKKVLQYVKEIHHHHEVSNYNVKADIVQLGEGNKLVMKKKRQRENQQHSEEMEEEEEEEQEEEEEDKTE